MKSQSGWIKIALFGLIIRVVCILVLSGFQNVYKQQLIVTDIDYKVYSDATLYDSPYERHTYRYTPLLSYMMSANYSVHESIGKICLALFDFIAVGFLYATLSRYNNKNFEKTSLFNATFAAKLYAYNPLFIYLTVRGSCESISLALMYAFWYYLYGGEASGNQSTVQLLTNKVQNTQPQTWKRYLAYAIYGLWVHVRVYPIILLPLIIMYEYHSVRANKFNHGFRRFIQMGVISGGVFILLAAIFYLIYGFQFIEETYLYHLFRKDNRHSFSPLFYEIYLNLDSDSISRSFMRVIPSLFILVTLSFRFVKNYSPFYLHFLVTFGFVTFNKVITLQYYMWIFGSLILVLPESLILTKKHFRMGFGLCLQYIFPILVWIWLSLRLEGAGENNLHTMWLICLFQILMHLWVLVSFMKTVRRWNPLQEKKMKLDAAKKMLSGKSD